jgi:hypothetical protein
MNSSDYDEKIKSGEAFLKSTICKFGLESYFAEVSQSTELDANFFIYLRGKHIPCIVKLDLHAKSIGNCSIEVSSSNKNNPTADSYKYNFWFHIFNENEIYFATREKLSKFIGRNRPSEILMSSDGTEVYRYNLDTVLTRLFAPLRQQSLIGQLREAIAKEKKKRDKKRTKRAAYAAKAKRNMVIS